MDIVGAIKRLVSLGVTGFSEVGKFGEAFNVKRYIDVINAISESKAAKFEESTVLKMTKLMGLYVWMNIISLAITFMSTHFRIASLIGAFSSAVAIVVSLIIYGVIIELLQKHKDNIPCFVILIGLVLIIANIVGAIASIVGHIAFLGIAHSIKTFIWIGLGCVDVVILLAMAGALTSCTFWKSDTQS